MNNKELKKNIKNAEYLSVEIVEKLLTTYLNNPTISTENKDNYLKNKVMFVEYIYRSDNQELINFITNNLPKTTRRWTNYWLKKVLKKQKKYKKNSMHYMDINGLENFTLDNKSRKTTKYLSKLLKNCSLNKLIILINNNNLDNKIRNIIIDNFKTNTYSERELCLALSNYDLNNELKQILIDNYLNGIENNRYNKIDFTSRLKLLSIINDNEINNIIATDTIKKFNIKLYNGEVDIKSFVDIVSHYSNQDILYQYVDMFCTILNNLIDNHNVELAKTYLDLVKTLRNNDKVNRLIEQNFTRFLESIINSTSNIQKIDKEDLKDEELTNLTDIVSIIIKEVLKYEYADIKDIEYIGMGAYSFVLGIKSKIIKIGVVQEKYDIKNSSYVLQPIVRKKINDNYVIEVTEKVDTNIEVSKEDLYELYRNLRKEGTIWTDINSGNVGRLLKSNKPDSSLRTCLSNNNSYNQGLIGNNTKTLDKGKLVLIDLAYVFDENDKDIIIPRASSNTFRNFERRYLQEINIEKLENNLNNNLLLSRVKID